MLELFLTFFKIGAFTFGGGFAIIPVIREEVAIKRNWVPDGDFMDMIAITQTAPGAVAINTSVYVGYRLFGIPGALTAVLGLILPSIIIITTIAIFFVKFNELPWVQSAFKGIRAAVASMILYAAFLLGRKVLNPKGIGFILLGLLLIYFNVHPVLLLIIVTMLGLLTDRFLVGVNRKNDGAI